MTTKHQMSSEHEAQNPFSINPHALLSEIPQGTYQVQHNCDDNVLIEINHHADNHSCVTFTFSDRFEGEAVDDLFDRIYNMKIGNLSCVRLIDDMTNRVNIVEAKVSFGGKTVGDINMQIHDYMEELAHLIKNAAAVIQ